MISQNGSKSIQIFGYGPDKADKTVVDQLSKHVDTTFKRKVLDSAHKMFADSREGSLSNATYVMVGDSTREINGAYIYKLVSQSLNGFGVKTHLSAKAGLKARHWSTHTDNLQPGFPTVDDIMSLIPGDGSQCVVDICLGINDHGDSTPDQIYTYIKYGIDIILAARPNTKIIVTSPNKYHYTPAIDTFNYVYRRLADDGYGFIDVQNNVFDTWSTEVMNTYFVDNTHPAELGQRKMAEYIVKQLVPSYLFVDGYRDLKGYLDSTDANSKTILNCGLKVEVKYLNNDNPVNTLYLYANDIGEWYITHTPNVKSITGKISMQNGVQSLSKPSWGDYNIEGFVYLSDYTVLQNYGTFPSPFFKIADGVVTEITSLSLPSKQIAKMNNEMKQIRADVSNNYLQNKFIPQLVSGKFVKLATIPLTFRYATAGMTFLIHELGSANVNSALVSFAITQSAALGSDANKKCVIDIINNGGTTLEFVNSMFIIRTVELTASKTVVELYLKNSMAGDRRYAFTLIKGATDSRVDVQVNSEIEVLDSMRSAAVGTTDVNAKQRESHILQSPNGTAWKLSVNDSGVISTAAIT
ncbi:hypothetical protein M4D55_23405 [Metabacillus idriensis]|uniref:SGNH/GDSL hydrolase family protein n=1 Tax=Metabacillus idriensis TaxID=324768 RepID=UPI00203CF85E|nr:hypothetical protein [Metabacillus idriensis]MCM3598710.1 hypothetical protein [Metabacillus idriensis]